MSNDESRANSGARTIKINKQNKQEDELVPNKDYFTKKFIRRPKPRTMASDNACTTNEIVDSSAQFSHVISGTQINDPHVMSGGFANNRRKSLVETSNNMSTNISTPLIGGKKRSIP